MQVDWEFCRLGALNTVPAVSDTSHASNRRRPQRASKRVEGEPSWNLAGKTIDDGFGMIATVSQKKC